jgi:hypothetical protein
MEDIPKRTRPACVFCSSNVWYILEAKNADINPTPLSVVKIDELSFRRRQALHAVATPGENYCALGIDKDVDADTQPLDRLNNLLSRESHFRRHWRLSV